MKREDKLQLIWAVTFVISGIIFALAFWFTPIIGIYAALGYIILYVGLASAFLYVFKHIETLNVNLLETLEERKDEIEEMKKEIEKKYFRKKIDEETFRRLMQKYEEKLTELNVKIKKLKGD